MPSDFDVIAPNLKRRLSGVTATIERLVPLQARKIPIVATGPGLSPHVPKRPLWQIITMPRKKRRVWHARRNTEMLLGLILKHVLRKNLGLLFTSASQRHHTGYTRWLISKMDHVVATSKKGQAYLEVSSEVILHGIDTDQFAQSDDKSALRARLGLPQDALLLGCFGRIRHQKGTDIFVDAMMDLARDHPVHGVILGRATKKHLAFQSELQARIASAGLEDRIRFYGEVGVYDIPQWYAALDLFVAPQRWEGFGLTPLEAMAAGVPVVAAKVGAFEELVVPFETGALVDPDDLAAMTKAIKAALPHADRMGATARIHVEKGFSLAREADALIEVYQRML